MGHTFTNHQYHIVFSTKGRRQLIKENVREELHNYMCGIAKNTQGQILNINSAPDHIHLLAKVKPSIAVSDFVRTIKANSSKWAAQRGDFDWQDGYSSFTVSQSVAPSVATYIGRQAEHHRRLSFAEELSALLEKHQVDYHPDHFLD